MDATTQTNYEKSFYSCRKNNIIDPKNSLLNNTYSILD